MYSGTTSRQNIWYIRYSHSKRFICIGISGFGATGCAVIEGMPV